MKAISAIPFGALALLTTTSALAQMDAACRQWASQNAHFAQFQANQNAVGSTFGGALLGAGIGALAGGGRGAAIGAGAGAFTGAVAGGARAQGAGNQAWWNAYNYCMSPRRAAGVPAQAGWSTRGLNQWELQQWQ
jgi:hypothetical protein